MIASFWLLYPVFGAIGVAAAVSRGERPQDAGFSFLPELIIFSPFFFGLAFVIDYVAMPWGRRIVSSICIMLLIWGVVSSIFGIIAMSRSKNAA